MFVAYTCQLDMSVDLDRLESFLSAIGEEHFDYLWEEWTDTLMVTPRMLMQIYRHFPGWVESAERLYIYSLAA